MVRAVTCRDPWILSPVEETAKLCVEGIVKIKLLVCVMVATVSSVALADNLSDAKAAFAEGRAAFERGDYERALGEFQKANALAPAPSLQYNMGKTYEKLGRYKDAVAAFEKYLELVGAPANDEDKKFQEDLKLRIEADRKQPDRAPAPAPQPGQPQPQPYYQPAPQPQPYYYNNPYQPAYNPYGYQQPIVNPREVRLSTAKRKRTNGIVQTTVGGFFLIMGVALTADACARTLGCNFGTSLVSSSRKADATIELVFSVPSLIVGAIVTPIGVANLAVGARDVSRIEHEKPAGGPTPGVAPQAMMLSSPVFRF
jgi:hypothetical protein